MTSLAMQDWIQTVLLQMVVPMELPATIPEPVEAGILMPIEAPMELIRNSILKAAI